jgi:hypothetical protein
VPYTDIAVAVTTARTQTILNLVRTLASLS